MISPEGVEFWIRPELIGCVSLSLQPEVILTNMTTAMKCTQESALRIIQEINTSPTSPILLGPVLTAPLRPV